MNDPMLQAWILNIAEEFWPSLARVCVPLHTHRLKTMLIISSDGRRNHQMAAIRRTERVGKPPQMSLKIPRADHLRQGYSLSHNTDKNPFDVIKQDAKRQQQFIDAMSYSHLHSSYSMDHLIENYDFGSIGAGTLVDIGGSHGQVSIALAQKYPGIKFIVQDLPDTIVGLESRLPKSLKGRISGMEHDFLTPQPIKDADIYLLRWILHDWSDKYCVKILQALIPALKKGAKIVINDICIPEPGQMGIGADRALR